MTDQQIVVYTVVFDDFDVILTPRVSPENVDYVCFTNTPDTVPDGWEIREMEKIGRTVRRASRAVKIRPHKYFPEYEYSVYVDGNFHVVGDVSELVDAHLDEFDMVLPSHPRRNCIYDEAKSCIELGLGDGSTIRDQMAQYRDRGFPEQWGLSNTHIMLRRHHDPTVRAAMEDWWDEYRAGAQRDQLSFEFAAWANDLSYDHFPVDYFQEGGYFFHYPHKPPGLAGDVWATMLRDDRYRRNRSQGQVLGTNPFTSCSEAHSFCEWTVPERSRSHFENGYLSNSMWGQTFPRLNLDSRRRAASEPEIREAGDYRE